MWFFIHRRQKELERRIETVPPRALETLRRYPWPGNVRELENVVEQAMILSTGQTLELEGALPVSAPLASPSPPDLDLAVHPNTLRFRMKKLGITRPARPGSRRRLPNPRTGAGDFGRMGTARSCTGCPGWWP